MTIATCSDLLDLGQVNAFGQSQVGGFVVALSALYFFVSVGIVYLIRRQQVHAEDGDDKAMKAVIFPIFMYVLWANALVNIYVGFITLAFDYRRLGEASFNGQLYAFSVMYGVQHVVTEGVAFMLMQKGVGRNAAIRSLRYAAVWGVVTFVCYSIEYSGRNKKAQQFFGLLWNIVLLLFYGALWLTPQKRLYRRPALMLYAKFWFFFRIVCIVVLALYALPATEDAAQCLNVFGTLYPFAILEPIVLYYTLLQDSRWWQGLDISQGRRTESVEEIRSPLQGVDLALDSAQNLAEQLDSFNSGGLRRRMLESGSHTVSSLTAARGSSAGAPTVRLLNFAYIHLDRTKMLGSGSFSKVYMGKYRTRKCAIKLVFTLDLTREIIRRVAAEAQLLSSIRHPNIVEILGVSVLPPSVCLLLELCAYGSLADIIHGTGALDLYEEPVAVRSGDIETGGGGFTSTPLAPSGGYGYGQVPFIEEFMRGGPSIAYANKRHLALSWSDRLHLAIGCARGLHALHSFAQNLCHRDVKSFNFLVDEKLNAKLSDLELGTAAADDDPAASGATRGGGRRGAGNATAAGGRATGGGGDGNESVSSVASSSLSRFSLTSRYRTYVSRPCVAVSCVAVCLADLCLVCCVSCAVCVAGRVAR